MSDPTPEVVRGLWVHMQEQYGSRIVSKSDSGLMLVVADALAALGVQSRERFLERFATTIERTIYLPFEVGEEAAAWSLWSQVVVCVHEHQHVQQYLDEGIRFEAKYIARPAQRAAYEAEAYRTGMEMDWWRFGRMAEPDEQAARLRAYGCSTADIESAAQILRLSQETIRFGGRGPVAQEAVSWLEVNAPEVREVST